MRLALTCLLMLTAACSTPARSVAPGEEFPLALGETVSVAGHSVSVTFDRVIEEGRCPTDLTCIWEGNALIAVRLSPGTELHLNTNARFPMRRTSGALAFELRRLEPMPVSQAQNLPYVATLIVEAAHE